MCSGVGGVGVDLSTGIGGVSGFEARKFFGGSVGGSSVMPESDELEWVESGRFEKLSESSKIRLH